MRSMSNRRQSNERQSPIGAETSDEETQQQHQQKPQISTSKLNFDQEDNDWGSWEDDEDINNKSGRF